MQKILQKYTKKPLFVKEDDEFLLKTMEEYKQINQVEKYIKILEKYFKLYQNCTKSIEFLQ